MNTAFFRKYLLPGFVFQSITIGGGYGTGRELVEFFMKEGPVSGLLGMVVSMIVWSIVMAISFELARITKSFDYRSFIRTYLGNFWGLYEIVYLSGLILVLSVIGSAAGELLANATGISSFYGIIMMISLVGTLSYFGTEVIEKTLALWSFALYGAFIFLIIITYSQLGGHIAETLSIADGTGGWFSAGIRYAGYNIGVLPAMIFVARHFDNRREALTSGILSGAITMIPGFLIYTSLLGIYPSPLTASVPIDKLLEGLNILWFMVIFRVILFGTFVETGVGLIHGFNERLSSIYKEKNKTFPNYWRLIIAVTLLIISVFVADAIGIISLIAKGYGALTWGYIFVFVIPVMVYGVYRMVKA